MSEPSTGPTSAPRKSKGRPAVRAGRVKVIAYLDAVEAEALKRLAARRRRSVCAEVALAIELHVERARKEE